MKKIFWVYLAILITGLVILAWPEEDNQMMVRLSETHGPSGVDLSGIVIIMAGYIPMVLTVWRSSPTLLQQLGSRNWYILLALTFISILFIILGLYIANDIALWLAVAVSTIAQAVIIYRTFKK